MAKRSLTGRSDFPPLLHLTYVLQQSADENLLKEVGVGLSQVRIMSVLSSSFPRSQRSVASELNQTEANVSRQLRTMQKRGLVSVKRNKKDGRQKDVALTAKGNSRYQKAEKLLKNQQNRIYKLIDKGETQSLNRVLSKLSREL